MSPECILICGVLRIKSNVNLGALLKTDSYSILTIGGARAVHLERPEARWI